MKSIVVEVILRALFSLNTRDVSDYELRGGFNAQFFPFKQEENTCFLLKSGQTKRYTHKNTKTHRRVSPQKTFYIQ